MRKFVIFILIVILIFTILNCPNTTTDPTTNANTNSDSNSNSNENSNANSNDNANSNNVSYISNSWNRATETAEFCIRSCHSSISPQSTIFGIATFDILLDESDKFLVCTLISLPLTV